MYDPAYYEKLLLSGCARPEKVVVLGEGERTAYRHEVLGVGANNSFKPDPLRGSAKFRC